MLDRIPDHTAEPGMCIDFEHGCYLPLAVTLRAVYWLPSVTYFTRTGDPCLTCLSDLRPPSNCVLSLTTKVKREPPPSFLTASFPALASTITTVPGYSIPASA